MTSIAAIIYILCNCFIIGFQLLLAAGQPWGEFTLGGFHRGVLPRKMRMGAVFQALFIVFVTVVVADFAAFIDIFGAGFAAIAIWFVVLLAVVTAILNAITPSPRERRLWLPIASVMVVSSLVMALGW